MIWLRRKTNYDNDTTYVYERVFKTSKQIWPTIYIVYNTNTTLYKVVEQAGPNDMVLFSKDDMIEDEGPNG